METQKLYYSRPYLRETRATVLDIRKEKDALGLLLNQTIFYPGGGGQPADRGLLAGKELRTVRAEKEEIWHWIPPQEVNPGDEVNLKLNWDWRYYQMQQHTGQHLLSSVLHRHHLPTVSVHLGEEYTLIEVEGAVTDELFPAQVEQEANALIRQALPVRQHWATPQDIDRFPLRRPPGAYEKLRVIEIDQTDYAACGGIHLQNTAEIGLIKALGREKIRGHARLKFAIGDRAYAYFGEIHHLTREIRKLLKIHHSEAIRRIEGLLDDLAEARGQNKKLLAEIIEYQALQLLNRDKNSGMVVYKLGPEEMGRASLLARRIAEKGCCLAFIMAEERFFLAWPQEQIRFNGHLFIKECAQKLGLQGGGGQGFLQGKIAHDDVKIIRRCLQDHLSR